MKTRAETAAIMRRHRLAVVSRMAEQEAARVRNEAEARRAKAAQEMSLPGHGAGEDGRGTEPSPVAPGVCPKCGKHIGRGVHFHVKHCDG